MVVTCDVRIASDVERLVERTLETFERVDIVVNNAGIPPVRVEPQEIGEANWDAILDTNLKGTFLLSTTAVLCSSTEQFIAAWQQHHQGPPGWRGGRGSRG